MYGTSRMRAIGSGALTGGWLSSFDPDRHIEKARRRTGLREFGDEDLRDSLTRLFDSCQRESRLSLIGRIAVLRDTSRLLETRLRLNELWRSDPRILSQSVRRPIFITGVPRSGTTLLQRLFAQDPSIRVPLTWEVMYPIPWHRASGRTPDPRIRKTEGALAWLDRLAPGFRAVHAVGATLPQECIAITSYTFQSPQFHTTFATPTYEAWLSGRERCPEYGFHRNFLQHLQWQRPDARWVLKAPSHLYTLDGLLTAYPDATVIQTHRDPTAVIGSVASLTEILQGAFSHSVDRYAIGREVVERWSRAVAHARRVRESNPDAQDRFLDVRYSDFLADPMRIVHDLYERTGMKLSPEARTRMLRYLDENPKGRHGMHRYSLARYGLRTESVTREFAEYRSWYRIAAER